MYELKINPELRDFIPPLSGEEKKSLEDSLLKYGYKGAPIYIWHNYIVDGHNRYNLCMKHNIEFPVEELDFGDEATIIDVMEWMINTQLGRRNLPPQQRIAVVKKFEKKIQEQARENQSEAGKKFGNGKNSSSPNGEKLNDKKIRTDKELAKLAGVGTGTIARFNRVMSSDDEELKKKLLADEVKINTAYEKIREKEKPKENVTTELLQTTPKTYQEAAQLFGGLQQGHLPNRKNTEKSDNFTDEQLLNALISTKTPVNVLDSIIPKQEFDIMTNTLLENIDSCDYRIFDLHEVYKKMENEDIDYAIAKFDSVIEAIMKLEEKIKEFVKETK
ncbi:hypothetical protein [Enterocloster clostridioformis]|uniref:ParB/Sulfiredoxin domain-containing protein n=1 Tax=Enterocloster clostridioformis TaxID=1531 RepID=A0AAP9S9R5_9FIRM|nr:hypothetical protein [Enterocloster clostridioformis]EHG33172.1 hypothetical protein HMPREF9467_00783 [ [[Clostridium] clostridioforme 2_1_49FAA]QIX93913.1 hypothetical protein FOC47_27255 [Enterocloster clostridioformis]